MAPFAVLFPAFCDALREPDPEFQRELQALEELGIPWRVVNIAALTRGDVAGALRFFGQVPSEPILYRGWILHPAEFTALSQALVSQGARLLTSPAEYRRALLFPEFFAAIADQSFPAVWIRGSDPERALEAARGLGRPPYFIKDYAKSAKEIWPRGCLASSEAALAGCIRELVAYRGERFEGGVVIRPFVRLRYLEESAFGGKIFEEYRLFFFRGSLIAKTAYDRVGGNSASIPDYLFLAERIGSPFFTADVVVSEEGRRYVLEIGDGGSSALPPSVVHRDFYRAITRSLASGQPGRVA